MIGSFSDSGELQGWASARARESRDDYASSGALVALGYALAMDDVAASLVRGQVVAPALQLVARDEPLALTAEAA